MFLHFDIKEKYFRLLTIYHWIFLYSTIENYMHFEIYIKLVYVNATLFYTTNLILTNLMQRGADLGTI